MSQNPLHSLIPRPLVGKVILIVEDDEDTCTLLVETLALEGRYHPIAVESGSRAIHVIQSIKVDLCLVDYLLPDGTGLDLYDQLCTLEEFGATPVLFLTATGDEEQQAILARHLPVVAKPFELEDLLEAIEAQLLPVTSALPSPHAQTEEL